MYIRKDELIRRLVAITGKDESEFTNKTVEELSALYENNIIDENVTYIEVPYKEKEIAKLLGARYDGTKKKWYVPQGVDIKHFSKWM